MKRAMVSVDIDVKKGGSYEFVAKVREPGILRELVMIGVPQPVILAAQKGPNVKLMPRLIFEVDPDGAPCERHFAMLPEGQTLDTHDTGCGLRYAGMLVHPHNQSTMFFFESIPPSETPSI